MTPPETRLPIRIARVASGAALALVGVVLMVLPGPGIPLLVGALALLGTEFDWARRLRGRLHRIGYRSAPRVRSALRWVMSRAAYGLAVLPVLTDWVDTGHWPQRPREFVTEIVVGLVILFGVWRLHRRAEHFRALSQTDSLTGVGNRARFRANLDSALARASVERCHVTIAMVDIDHFKAVNDTLGHATGDEVLREVAGSLARSIRQEGDGCFRLGGDEFAVLMIGVAPDQALVGLRRGFDRGKGVMGRPISCSIGVVTLREGESSGDLVNRADRLMYRAKRGEAADRDHGEAFGRATLGASVTDTVGLTGPLTSRTDGTRRRGQPPADS